MSYYFCFVLLPLGRVMLYPCTFCVALLMDLFVLCVACLPVFVNCLVKQFAIRSGVFAILLLNDCYGLVKCCWRCSIPKNVCVVPVIPECLDAPSICIVCVFVCRKLSPHLAVSELDHRCLLSFVCVILHTMFSGKSLQLLCIMPFGMLCLYPTSMMFVKILLAVCILVGKVV